MNIASKKYYIMIAFRKYLEGNDLLKFEKDIFKILDKGSDKLLVDIILKYVDLDKLKGSRYPNDYLLYNLIKYDYDGKSLKLASSKLMKLYLEKEHLI